jgi:2-keto-4-pentenoate hydratase/2-oxohepta-3-ene-1,7-dioic acid hydratase in catechol pathway
MRTAKDLGPNGSTRRPDAEGAEMKLATYFDGKPRIGVADGLDLWDLREVYSRYLFEIERAPACREVAKTLVPSDMALFIRLNHRRLDEFEEALNFVKERRESMGAGAVRPLHGTRLLPPVPAPNKVICCGSSYGEYLEELKIERSKWPQDVKISFLKSPTSLIGHGETILFPPDAHETDYENELAIIVGRTCSDVSERDAAKFIFGYSILNDACVRDIPKWTGGLDSPRGKAGDTFAPCGPWIVPAQYLKGSANDLGLRTTVDGEVRQDSRTSNLLWPVERIVAFISRYMRLLPGDVIATGSTKGNAHTTGKFLKKGQIIRCEIEGIGTLENVAGWKTWKSELKPLSKP